MKSTEIANQGDLLTMQQMQVRQSNIITAGRYDFSACQLDVMFMILANLKEGEDKYLVHCKDIELITGRQWNYQQFKDATSDMITRMFEIENTETYTQLVLFQYFEYHKGKGTIEIQLSSKALPLFFNLKRDFTYLQLKSVLSCSSKYAKRIYGLCCQWRSIGIKTYSLQEFKAILGLYDIKTGEEQFRQITPFREKVLDIAKEQINRHTDIRFDYKLDKAFHSRSFNSITIYINQPDVKQLKIELEQNDIDFNKSVELQKNLKIIQAYGLSELQANRILENGTIEEFLRVIEDTKKAVVKGMVSNQIAYICGVLKNKGLL